MDANDIRKAVAAKAARDAAERAQAVIDLGQERDKTYNAFLTRLATTISQISPEQVMQTMHDQGAETLLIKLDHNDYYRLAEFGISDKSALFKGDTTLSDSRVDGKVFVASIPTELFRQHLMALTNDSTFTQLREAGLEAGIVPLFVMKQGDLPTNLFVVVSLYPIETISQAWKIGLSANLDMLNGSKVIIEPASVTDSSRPVASINITDLEAQIEAFRNPPPPTQPGVKEDAPREAAPSGAAPQKKKKVGFFDGILGRLEGPKSRQPEA